MLGLDFSKAVAHKNHEANIYKLRQLCVSGPFQSISTEYLTDRMQMVLVDVTIVSEEMYLVSLKGVY